MKAGERECLICCSTTIKILCHHCDSAEQRLGKRGRSDVVNSSHDSSQRNLKTEVVMGGPQGDFRKVLLHNS